ncbi:shikimate kinase [Ferruginivarius sediminum]|uniref:Shikimate kinase n=2 Tax=Ferruginivarius sediminum TaxID=2661937 RepID=A0A369TGB1_9PROT|nr:shikimate kinase [Ferruginivarius sediminum]RDD63425.1 shikimate kinase [Ferruginivarius sediminum]
MPESTSEIKVPRTIVLVGLMGAGKTCIGKRLAACLGTEFVDADAEIESAAGMSISEIFEVHGESGFRQGERRVIARLLRRPPHVMATGGGAFMNEKTRELIKRRAISVWLRADLDLLVRRTSRRSHRPLLRGRDHREVLGKLMEERHPVYAKADVVVDSADGPPEAMAEQVARAVMDYVRRSGIDGPEEVADDGCILPESDKEMTW